MPSIIIFRVVDFLNTIANIINERFETTYTGYLRDYTLMEQYIAGSRTGKRSRTGERYFEEFRSRFWARPETPFDLMHNANASTRRRHRNRTPPPTYEVPSIPNESPGRSASPTRRVPSRRDENTNRNNVNNLGGNLGNNTNNVGGNSSNNINDAGGNLGGNLDNAIYSSSSELANITSALNISASRNDSDLVCPMLEVVSLPLIWNL
ncbi:3409_t:CDS:2 [Ambispora leptoticha]|uniref:3409_t:CDS:1 n=1 Tax=Ambispora leptoticha TaxID=144679 RepID=A0A9N9EFP8_9GLOM|nr:3409_t:CDS:2 [Ambispora leptoticha]